MNVVFLQWLSSSNISQAYIKINNLVLVTSKISEGGRGAVIYCFDGISLIYELSCSCTQV